MTRFTKTAEYSTANDLVQEYTLEVAPGHVVSRVDRTSRLGAGRKGRAASVDLHRTLTCTCGAHAPFAGLTVAEDLQHLHHFDSVAERTAYEAEQADKKERILRALGLPS